MKDKEIHYLSVLIICFILAASINVLGQGIPKWLTIPQTDSSSPQNPESLTLFYVFDLRDRETFIQFTYQGILEIGDDDDSQTLPARAHVQIFDVSNNCNENNFFDVYTVNDTHVYNLRNIQTNDGNPSGVVLPDGAYGIVAISYTDINGKVPPLGAFGNLRIEDSKGYEYRTNAQQLFDTIPFQEDDSDLNPAYTFNFNIENGVTLSDVIGVTINSQFNLQGGSDDDDSGFFFEWDATDILSAFNPFDIDILDNNETIFSCRDITFGCVNQEHPLLEELLSEAGTSVASFEYGINNAIPHSKAGELLCPGNTITEGFVVLNPEGSIRFEDIEFEPHFLGFIGLNNGNGRGSMDSFWVINICQLFGICEIE